MAKILVDWSQCTYRCVVLPDPILVRVRRDRKVSQCTYRCVVLPDTRVITAAATLARRLNAPTGAWCSLTDFDEDALWSLLTVSMHLQVRGAP